MRDDRLSSSNPSIDRRGFLAAGLALGLGAGALGVQEPPGGQAGPGSRATMPLREFGKSGRRLPIVAFGGSAMVKRWEVTYGPQLPHEQRVAMVRHAFDVGVRYFDTSPNYGESETIIGEALEGVRGQVYLATKVGVPTTDDAILTREQVRASVEGSLERLRADAVDCIQVHGPAFEYNGQKRAEELYEELVTLREEKLCRWIGLTGHNKYDIMFRLIDSGRFDQLLVGYGYFPKGMDTILSHANLQWRERCLTRAHELGMGVLAMKVMGSFVFGHAAPSIAPGIGPEKLAHLRAAALRWVMQDERVTLAVIGVTRPDQVDQNIGTLTGPLPVTQADRDVLAGFSAQALESPIIKRLQIQ